MKDLKITKGDYFPTAYEWHNKYTGHCYVDYMAHPGQDNDDGYTGTPLYYFPSELLKQRDELLDALKEIAECKGAYSMDRLEHATNVIKEAKAIAEHAITKAEER